MDAVFLLAIVGLALLSHLMIAACNRRGGH